MRPILTSDRRSPGVARAAAEAAPQWASSASSIADAAPRRSWPAERRYPQVPWVSEESAPTGRDGPHLAKDSDAYQVVEVPYEKDRLSMVLVLPEDLGEFEAGLDEGRLSAAVIRFDRPFVFFIQNKAQRTILFAGRVTDPSR